MTSNSRLLTCSENLCVWNLNSLSSSSLIHKFTHSTAKSFATLAWDTVDQFICVPAEEKKLVICDLVDDEMAWKEYDLEVNVSAVSCGRKSSCVAVGSVTGEVQVWSKKQKKIVKTIAEMPSGVTSLQYNISDSHIAVGCVNGTINVYNTTSGFSGSSLQQDTSLFAVRNLHFHQKHKFLLGSCYDGGQILLWDIHKSCLYQSLPETHKAPAMDLSFSPLGNSIVASVGLDKRIFLHDVRLKSTVQNILCEVPLRSLDFLPGGVALVVGGSKGMIYVYDLRNSTTPNSFAAHTKQVQKIAVSSLHSNTIKKKREMKPRNILSPTTNKDPNRNRDCYVTSPSSAENDGIPVTSAEEKFTQDVNDIRKLVLKKSAENFTASSNEIHAKVQSSFPVNSPVVNFEVEDCVFSPPRTDFVSDDKENLNITAMAVADTAEQEICMETEDNNDSPEVPKKVEEESQKVIRDNLVESNTEAFRSLHKDMMNMHFQMIKQFTAQQIQMQELNETCKVNRSLVEEVQFLREENRRLKTLLDSLKINC